jgi:hypothetical protein
VTAITRRQLLGEAALAVGAVWLAGCSGPPTRPPASTGSTLLTRWADPVGDGQLRVLTGEPLLPRLELGPMAAPGRTLATLAHVTDAHVLDASSPARVPFLARLGAPFQSTFRPHETLTTQVLAGMVRSVRTLRPDLVIQGGDLIDNDQANELEQALTVLAGGQVRPGSGHDGYYGVQLASDPDPFYYRPDLDAPRHPGLLRAATRPFAVSGLGLAWCPVLGDHDTLVAGELVPTPLTRSLAVGSRALWDLPSGLTLPRGLRQLAQSSPDGPPAPLMVERFLRRALAGPTVPVPPDPSRHQLTDLEVAQRLRQAADAQVSGSRLDYVIDLGDRLRLVVLDLVRRGGGSGGLIAPGQPAWLGRQLAGAGGRWVMVVSHQPLATSLGGDSILGLLDRSPSVIATLCGHTHRNRILPRATPSGGYWQIETASLIDYPQQARAVRIIETDGGGVAIRTWMLDHVGPGPLGAISRQLSYLDAQGGRPEGFAGRTADRNVVLYRRAA